MQRSIILLILLLLIDIPVYGQTLINLFNFDGDFQGWEIVEGNQYGDTHLCGGNMLSAWIGWNRDEWTPEGLPLPAYSPLSFQSSYFGDFPHALEFLADVYYYSLPDQSYLPLEARLYLLTEIRPYPRFGDYIDPFNPSYNPNVSNPFLYAGEWTTLLREPKANVISLSTINIPNLYNIQAIGISFQSRVDFRGKVKFDNLRVRVQPVPEPATIGLFALSVGFSVILRRLLSKLKHQ